MSRVPDPRKGGKKESDADKRGQREADRRDDKANSPGDENGNGDDSK